MQGLVNVYLLSGRVFSIRAMTSSYPRSSKISLNTGYDCLPLRSNLLINRVVFFCGVGGCALSISSCKDKWMNLKYEIYYQMTSVREAIVSSSCNLDIFKSMLVKRERGREREREGESPNHSDMVIDETGVFVLYELKTFFVIIWI